MLNPHDRRQTPRGERQDHGLPRITIRLYDADRADLDVIQAHLRTHGHRWVQKRDVMRYAIQRAVAEIQENAP